MNIVKSFDEIDETYAKYLAAVSGKNNESQIETLVSQIMEEIWCNLHSYRKFEKLLDDFPDEMIDVCKYWIKKYSTNNDYHGFSACTFKYIKMRLNTCAAEKSFDDSTSGMHVTDEYKRTQNTLKRLYKTFVSFRKSVVSEEELNNKFVDYASEYLNIDKSIVIDFLKPQHKTPIEIKGDNNSEEEVDITDLFGGTTVFSSSKAVEDEERLAIVLVPIEEKWEKQKENSKTLFSELLTLILIEAVEAKYFEMGDNTTEGIKTLTSKYKFISKEMMENYINGKMHSLSSQQDIAMKYGLTKSAVSVKIKRFFEDLHINEKLSNYDKDTL